ncbi:MAG: decaprenyl-phosphate phosphoribosyltransferase [Phycisphaerae bacterium]|nr:decaprenyl-phosphate phosphoribosyltransferase [Phycisphaerae bacterium]
MKYLTLMRPSHWSKNLFVFAALVFGRKLLGPTEEVAVAAASAVGAFLCFSLAASAMYILNDILDSEADRLHPEKQNRPVAAGLIPVGSAIVFSFVCMLAALGGSLMLAKSFAVIIAAYIVLMTLYSFFFKKIMILDCIVIAVGFCFRAVAGAVVIGVFISPWLIICTFALCLFLAFSKRRSEIQQLGDEGKNFRITLDGYSPELLSHMLDVTSGLAVVCFLLYTMDDRTLQVFKTNNLVYTTPFVLYGVFRFSALIQKGSYTSPVGLIIHDRPFQINFVLWVAACIGIVYADRLFGTFGNIWAY